MKSFPWKWNHDSALNFRWLCILLAYSFIGFSGIGYIIPNGIQFLAILRKSFHFQTIQYHWIFHSVFSLESSAFYQIINCVLQFLFLYILCIKDWCLNIKDSAWKCCSLFFHYWIFLTWSSVFSYLLHFSLICYSFHYHHIVFTFSSHHFFLTFKSFSRLFSAIFFIHYSLNIPHYSLFFSFLFHFHFFVWHSQHDDDKNNNQCHLHATLIVPPNIDDSLSSSDVIVREGSNVTLRCRASGSPTPVVKWKRDSMEKIAINKSLVGK